MATPKQRIYKVAGSGDVFLVRAATRGQAVGYVARNLYAVTMPSQDELITLGRTGIAVQEASEEATA